LISALFRIEWAVTEDALARMIELRPARPGPREAARAGARGARRQPLKNARTVELRDGVAVIPVSGPLFRHADMLTELCGATSYATLRKDLQTAIDDRGQTRSC
jgi:hypothetical protein